MGITGEAIHQIYVESTALRTLPWAEIGNISQSTYNDLAEKLNAQYVAPLQGRVEELENEKHAVYEESVHFAQAVTERGEQIAQLEQSELALKALLTSYRAFVVRTCPGSYDTECAGLLQITDVLLKDEQKEK